ncbi:MAG: tetratricopeptide repeat protein [Candidatus Aminicenantes bacterium]|nr:MAG: tetratricopeptide repeat protein [Candidatus Aminicenantes bacterium]
MFNRNYSSVMVMLILSVFTFGLAWANGDLPQEHDENFVIAKYSKIQSKILNEERTIVVHLPGGYEKSLFSYPVLYVLDADFEDLFIKAVATSGYLNAFGLIPKLIVVGLCNTDRNRDMIPVKIKREPTSGGAAFFLRFISEELMPFIEKKYRTEPFTILYGGSYAGLFTVNAFLEKPEACNAYIASSPGIGICPDYLYAKAEKLLGKKTSLPRYLYLVYGEHDYPQSTGHTSDFYDFIMPKSPGDFKCQMKMVENEGHVPFIGLYEGLRFIFDEWKLPDDRRAKAGLNEIKQHFGNVAKKYNYKPVIPADILIGLGYRLIRQGKFTEAVEALLFACQIHPYSPDAFYYLGEAYEKNNQIELALKNYKKALAVESSYLMAAQKIQSLDKKKWQ